jgi:exodeoxyribonuclease V alpha subunit
MSTRLSGVRRDPFDSETALGAPALLASFNRGGVLIAADVHVARRLGALLGEADEAVLLAAALAVRGPRVGHVCIDLPAVRQTVAVDRDATADVQELAWPEVAPWLDAVAGSPLVAVGDAAPLDRPFRLVGTRLYLDRYWRDEVRVASQLLGRARGAAAGVGDIQGALARLFPDAGDTARLAAERAADSRLVVITGGPGTGKTTAVAKIAALLCAQARQAQRPMPLLAVAAPTGKAADRLQEAIREQAPRLAVEPEIRNVIAGLETSTLHRLLGSRAGTRTRFAHDREHPLVHDVVVVDEASMVPLALMARLLEALRTDARLVLVGDPGQLASVEAGTVLGDVVGPAGAGTASGVLAGNIVVLGRVHRFGQAIAQLANAIRNGRPDETVAALRAGGAEIDWIDSGRNPEGWGAVREEALAAGRRTLASARRGDARAALDSLGGFRVLCAHRRGVHGVASWTLMLESWLAEAEPGFRAGAPWYLGRPVMVTANDYALGLFNGDPGVVIAGDHGRPEVAFARGSSVIRISPTRLDDAETVHAMTIHKSQGSQFATVVVVVPDESSPLLTRELLYTAVTRARTRVVVVGSEAAIRAAVTRPIARASGLRERLWGGR